MPHLDPFWLDARFRYVGKSLWTLIQGMEPIRSDVALAVFATFSEQRSGVPTERPLLTSVMITTDSVLRLAGAIKRNGDRTNLNREIGSALDGLANVVFDIGMANADEPAEMLHHRTRGSRLFDIVKIGASDTDRSVPDEPAWYVRGGQWAYWGPDARERRWICQISKVLLTLRYRSHPETAVTAVDIARHVLASDLPCVSGPVIQLRLDRLLQAVGALPGDRECDESEARSIGRRANRALAALDGAGLFEAIGTKLDLQAEPGAPAKALAETWFSTDVTFVLHARAADAKC